MCDSKSDGEKTGNWRARRDRSNKRKTNERSEGKGGGVRGQGRGLGDTERTGKERR